MATYRGWRLIEGVTDFEWSDGGPHERTLTILGAPDALRDVARRLVEITLAGWPNCSCPDSCGTCAHPIGFTVGCEECSGHTVECLDGRAVTSTQIIGRN